MRRGVALVCHPHPLGGGTMHNKVVYRAARDFRRGTRRASLNFRGRRIDRRARRRRRRATGRLDALAFLTENYPNQPITLAGFSFGSRVGAEVAMDDARVVRLISIGTPVDKYDFSFLKNVRSRFCSSTAIRRIRFGRTLNALIVQVSENADATLIVFENCGHFFDNHLNQLKDATRLGLENCRRNNEQGWRIKGFLKFLSLSSFILLIAFSATKEMEETKEKTPKECAAAIRSR